MFTRLHEEEEQEARGYDGMLIDTQHLKGIMFTQQKAEGAQTRYLTAPSV
jgi:hypothetical protein